MNSTKLDIIIFSILLVLFATVYYVLSSDLWESIANMVDAMLEFMASESRNVAQNL